jgi:hypothetical protein
MYRPGREQWSFMHRNIGKRESTQSCKHCNNEEKWFHFAAFCMKNYVDIIADLENMPESVYIPKSRNRNFPTTRNRKSWS